MIKVTIYDKVLEVGAGTRYEDILRRYDENLLEQTALVKVGGKLKELSKKSENDEIIVPITLNTSAGHKTYERTATMIMLKSLADVIGDAKRGRAKVEFKVDNGIYISCQGDYVPDKELAAKVKARMQELIEADLSIEKDAMPIAKAVARFAKQGMTDKVKLFSYRRSSFVNVYRIEDYFDYYYGAMLPSTGYVKWFDIKAYSNGLLLILPHIRTPEVVDEFCPKNKLFDALVMGTEWGKQMGIATVADLNDAICAGNMEQVILIQEALQERRISEIATEIAGRGGVKFVMIAGPSSSGKTSFSHRLSIQLKTHGLNPHPIAVDNYFVDRENTPRQANGDYDYECLEAIDVEQFNKDMTELLEGKEVSLPTFNFKLGKREYKGEKLKLNKDDILVIEGIHGLNERMSYTLPNDSKYKVYISALTTLNIDGHNRIPINDGRLLRRMIRDYRTRGASAQRTIQMWSNVRKGEEENIFPFQEEADAMFNSTLIYELAAIKTYAEPILFSVKKDEPEYIEARRLLKFLEYFISIPIDRIPNNSLAREFVGGSCFDV